jgi:hypothetical protein
MKKKKGYGNLLLNIFEESELDKIMNQLDIYLKDSNKDIVYEILIVFIQIVQKVDKRFRNNYILKKVYDCCKILFLKIRQRK